MQYLVALVTVLVLCQKRGNNEQRHNDRKQHPPVTARQLQPGLAVDFILRDRPGGSDDGIHGFTYM